jgi:DNA replication and repair protein RecF
MTLARLQIQDFRCIAQADLELDDRCTLIVGPNGSGKTSFLEAIHVLSCGRSFRTHQLDLLIRKGTEQFTTVGFLSTADRQTVLGVQYSGEGLEARVAGHKARGFADLAAQLPVQVIDPNVHNLIESGPDARRTFLDRGLFHVEPQFVQLWRRYQRALKQRNRALKLGGAPAFIRAWDDELCQSGTQIAAERERYIAELAEPLVRIAGRFFARPIELRQSQGWAADLSLPAALDRAWARDQHVGSTTVGPHRADLVVSLNAQLARQHVSRGQQKMLAAALILAQLAHMAESRAHPGCLLLDDPAAELDVDNLSKLLGQIDITQAQLLVTSLENGPLAERFSARVFHVEQGQIT